MHMSTTGSESGPAAAEDHDRIQLRRLEILADAFPWCFRIFAVLHCLVGLAQVALVVMLIVALQSDWRTPCDRPLHAWVVVDLAHNLYQAVHGCTFHSLGQVSSSRCLRHFEKAIVLAIVMFSLVWDFVGLYWVFTADRCEQTAPRLYAAVKCYIIATLSVAMFIIINATGLYTILTRLVEFDFIEIEGAAPSGTLDRLDVVLFGEGRREAQHDAECCICMVEFARGGEARITPCKHVFHSKCLEGWFKVNRTCPLCRTDVVRELDLQEGSGLATPVGRPSADEGGARDGSQRSQAAEAVLM